MTNIANLNCQCPDASPPVRVNGLAFRFESREYDYLTVRGDFSFAYGILPENSIW